MLPKPVTAPVKTLAKPVAAPAKPAAAPIRPAPAKPVAAAPVKAAPAAAAAVAPGDQLAAMKARWAEGQKKAKAGGGSQGTTLSPGKHVCRITDCKIVDTAKGPAIVMEFTEIQGDEIGEKGTRWHNTETDEQLGHLLGDLRKLGVDTDALEPEELPELCANIAQTAPTVRINIKENGQYMNVYLDKLIEVDESTLAATEEAPAEESEAEAEAPAEEEAAAEEITEGDSVQYDYKKQRGVAIVLDISGDKATIKDTTTKVKLTVPLAVCEKMAVVEG